MKSSSRTKYYRLELDSWMDCKYWIDDDSIEIDDILKMGYTQIEPIIGKVGHYKSVCGDVAKYWFENGKYSFMCDTQDDSFDNKLFYLNAHIITSTDYMAMKSLRGRTISETLVDKIVGLYEWHHRQRKNGFESYKFNLELYPEYVDCAYVSDLGGRKSVISNLFDK
jgi:hypothetical protein